MFALHGSPGSIVFANQYGIGGYEMTARENDPPQPQWGDGVNGVICKRAQLIDGDRPETEGTSNVNLSVVIPSDWVIDSRPVMIAGLHGVTCNIQPWEVFVAGNVFWFSLNLEQPDGSVKEMRVTYPLILDKVFDFDITFCASKVKHGYLAVSVNGVPIWGYANYYGPTISVKETDRPYRQFGPYVFLQPGATWPMPYRRIFMAFRPFSV